MKGIISLIEVGIAGVILMLAFFHFFPKYSIKSDWDTVLLNTRAKDILNVIDNMHKTNDFATNTQEFNDFMENVLATSEQGAVIWWKDVDGLGLDDSKIPHFTKAQKVTILDATNVVFEDDFSNMNSLWFPNSDEWTIVDEKYKGPIDSTEISLLHFNITDAEIKSEVNINSGAKAGIVLRAKNNTHYYTFSGEPETNKWILEKWENQNSTQIEFLNAEVNTDQEYNFTAVLNGTTFKGYVNDTLMITHNDLDFDYGYVGLFVKDSTSYFDNFSIRKFVVYSFTLGIGYPY